MNPHKKKRLIFVGSIVLISLLSLLLIISNFRDNIVFFYSPKELRAPEILAKIKNRQIRAGGLVLAGSVKKIDALTTEFVITDLTDELKVIHRGVVPDLFRDNQGVVAKGKLQQEENVFYSSELLIKHDENYMPPEVEKAIR